MKIQDHYKNKISEIERQLRVCGAVIDVKASLMDINTPSERTKVDIFVNSKEKQDIEPCLNIQDKLLDMYKESLGLYFNMRYVNE